ncbi:hypothetical protein Tco_0357556 [Tanacetum coccineum]
MKVMKHRSHNKFHHSMACKSLMVELGKSGLRPCQVRKAVNAMKSPNEPTITSKQCVDILAKERKQYKDHVRKAAEEDEYFKTMNSRPDLSSIHPIEAKAGECYTKNIFELFQKEWIEATTNLTYETKSKSEEKSSYWVGRVNVDKRYWRIVNFCFVDDLDVTCSCAMYKGGNASIRIEETNCENGVSALALWYVQANLTKAIEQARDATFEIKRLNIQDPAVLTILKGRPRNATRVKPPIEVKKKKTVVLIVGNQVITSLGVGKRRLLPCKKKNNAYVVAFQYDLCASVCFSVLQSASHGVGKRRSSTASGDKSSSAAAKAESNTNYGIIQRRIPLDDDDDDDDVFDVLSLDSRQRSGLFIVHSRNSLGRLDHGLTEF